MGAPTRAPPPYGPIRTPCLQEEASLDASIAEAADEEERALKQQLRDVLVKEVGRLTAVQEKLVLQLQKLPRPSSADGGDGPGGTVLDQATANVGPLP